MKLFVKGQSPVQRGPTRKGEGTNLIRRGAWLHATNGSWQMHSVLGPFEADQEGREFFHVTTASKQKLVVSRALGDRGMRQLQLEHVLPADPEVLFTVLLSA